MKSALTSSENPVIMSGAELFNSNRASPVADLFQSPVRSPSGRY
jgi:hypothetical protein